MGLRIIKVKYVYHASMSIDWAQIALTEHYRIEPPRNFQQLNIVLKFAWLGHQWIGLKREVLANMKVGDFLRLFLACYSRIKAFICQCRLKW